MSLNRLLPIVIIILMFHEVVICEDDTSENDGASDEVEYKDEEYTNEYDNESKDTEIVLRGNDDNSTEYTGCIKGMIKLKPKSVITRSNSSYKANNTSKSDELEVNDVISQENLQTPNPTESIEDDLDDALNEILRKQPPFREKNTFRSGVNLHGVEPRSDSLSVESDFHIKSFPYTVCVHKKGSHITNGALLDKQWVLTGANEFINVRESIKIYNVRLGTTNCKNGKNIPIKMLEIHPSYRAGSPDFDLALLKLAYPVEFAEKIQPIKISAKKELSAITIIYWAKLHPVKTSKLFPPVLNTGKGFLRYCKLDTLSKDKCKSYLRKSNLKLIDASRCIKPADNENCKLWNYKTSSPIVTSDGLFGMTSPWLNENITETSPTVFTVLSQPLVKNWIYHVMMSK